MMNGIFEQLYALCNRDGVTNFEDDVREYILSKAHSCADTVFCDSVGNVFVCKKGACEPKRPILVLTNMDEPGFMVKEITSDGYLHVVAIDDYIDVRTVLGKKLWIGRNRVPGVVALKAIHLTPKSARGSIPDIDSLNVDIGAANREDAEKRVKCGDTAVPAYALTEMGDCLRGKGLTGRTGAAIALRLMQDELPYDTWFVFIKKSVLSPHFGGALAARRIDPGFSILLNCHEANDMPNIPEEKRMVTLRGGAALALKGASVCYNRQINRGLVTWAAERGIPTQYIQADRIRDAGQDLTAGASGGEAIALSVPVRYVNSMSPVACKRDIEAVYLLAQQALRKAGEILG